MDRFLLIRTQKNTFCDIFWRENSSISYSRRIRIDQSPQKRQEWKRVDSETCTVKRVWSNEKYFTKEATIGRRLTAYHNRQPTVQLSFVGADLSTFSVVLGRSVAKSESLKLDKAPFAVLFVRHQRYRWCLFKNLLCRPTCFSRILTSAPRTNLPHQDAFYLARGQHWPQRSWRCSGEDSTEQFYAVSSCSAQGLQEISPKPSMRSRQYAPCSVLCRTSSLFHAGLIVCPYISTGLCAVSKALFEINLQQGGINRFEKDISEHKSEMTNHHIICQKLSQSCTQNIADGSASPVVLDLRPLSFAEICDGMTRISLQDKQFLLASKSTKSRTCCREQL